jgi:hypothetical protein
VPALTEEDEVVTGEEGPFQGGKDGILITEDAGEQIIAPTEMGNQVVPDLFLDGAVNPRRGTQLTECGWPSHPSKIPSVGSLGIRQPAKWSP